MEQSKFYQIKNITEQEYNLVGCDGSVITLPIQEVDKTASVFTIQDAKDGDVLVDIYGNIGIFKRRSEINWHTYCYLENESRFISEGGSHGSISYPATKEQRDTLMKAMADAGWEFDFKKKELKKISQRMISAEVKEAMYDKPAWSEEDEYRLQSCLSILQAKGIMGVTETINTKWLKSLKGRVQQPNQEWSKEDEYNYNIILHHLDLRKEKYKKECNQEEQDRYQYLYEWLKSLRPQNTWKPSDEQIDALEHFVRSVGESGYAPPYENNTKLLYSLLSDLKELREE